MILKPCCLCKWILTSWSTFSSSHVILFLKSDFVKRKCLDFNKIGWFAWYTICVHVVLPLVDHCYATSMLYYPPTGTSREKPLFGFGTYMYMSLYFNVHIFSYISSWSTLPRNPPIIKSFARITMCTPRPLLGFGIWSLWGKALRLGKLGDGLYWQSLAEFD